MLRVGAGAPLRALLTASLPPRLAEEGIASAEGCPPTTLPALFAEAVAKAPAALALQVERPLPQLVKGLPPPPALPQEEWQKWTFEQYYSECRVAARAFMASVESAGDLSFAPCASSVKFLAASSACLRIDSGSL